ncbi:hypothetical protein BV210_04995 [Halorientalis sp. IM1011]|nr:hypothetical protein BV210_04995 [Halorientalis sp. IM1011]
MVLRFLIPDVCRWYCITLIEVLEQCRICTDEIWSDILEFDIIRNDSEPDIDLRCLTRGDRPLLHNSLF